MEDKTYTSQHRIIVYYEDTDFSGFVYHANYLKFFERAREHALGVRFLQQLFQDGVHFVVSDAQITFKAPSRHGDELDIVSTMHFGRGSALSFHQEAWLLPATANARLVCSAHIRLATLNAQHRPIRLPAPVLAHFNQLCMNKQPSHP